MSATAPRLRPAVLMQALMFVGVALAMLGNYYVYDDVGPVAELLTRELGFSDSQIGTLNAIYSLPNIGLVLIGGVLVDRFTARAVMLVTTAICLLGAVICAFGSHFEIMAAGRLVFGFGAETMAVAINVAIAQWFGGRYFALAMALNISLGRLGSYLADKSPSFAPDLYASGWQAPMWLAVAFGALSLAGAALYFMIDRREAPRGTLLLPPPPDRIEWRYIFSFNRQYWLVVGTCVAFYSVIFPFRSTFAIKYLQEAQGYSLAAAGTLNSYVFLAAVIATPLFGLLVDKIGRYATLLAAGSLLLPLSFLVLSHSGGAGLATALLGVSFSFVPAVLWPAVARYVPPTQLGTAYGLINAVQNAGLTLANFAAGFINDTSHASAANPAGYTPMLEFFFVLSVIAFGCALVLKLYDRSAGIPALAPDFGSNPAPPER